MDWKSRNQERERATRKGCIQNIALGGMVIFGIALLGTLLELLLTIATGGDVIEFFKNAEGEVSTFKVAVYFWGEVISVLLFFAFGGNLYAIKDKFKHK